MGTPALFPAEELLPPLGLLDGNCTSSHTGPCAGASDGGAHGSECAAGRLQLWGPRGHGGEPPCGQHIPPRP